MYFMKKIMIIEDDESISNELKELLQNSGYEAVILKNINNLLFMNMVENLYNERKNITLDDIEEFLIILSNQKKEKQKKLNIKKVNYC